MTRDPRWDITIEGRKDERESVGARDGMERARGGIGRVRRARKRWIAMGNGRKR